MVADVEWMKRCDKSTGWERYKVFHTKRKFAVNLEIKKQADKKIPFFKGKYLRPAEWLQFTGQYIQPKKNLANLTTIFQPPPLY